jgi:hypothetical protein
MVANPYYKFWSTAKPGDRAVQIEKTKLLGPEGKLVPNGIDEKRIDYKLIEVTDARAVVEMVVTEHDFLGSIQAAPTRYIYPAKVKKANLERILSDGKTGSDTVRVGTRELKCKTLSGTVKGPDGEKIDFKLWLSDKVPGTIVKQVRTARAKGDKGDLIAETTTTLRSFKKAE